MSRIVEDTRKRTVHSAHNSPEVGDDVVYDVNIKSQPKSRGRTSSCMLVLAVGGISVIIVLAVSSAPAKLAAIFGSGGNNQVIRNNKIQLPHDFEHRRIEDILDNIEIPVNEEYSNREQRSEDSPMKEKKTPPPSNAQNGEEGSSSKDRNVPSGNNKSGNGKVEISPPVKSTPYDAKKTGKIDETPPPKMVPPVSSGEDGPAKKSQPTKPLPSNNINGGKRETAPTGTKESPAKAKSEQGKRVPTPKIVTSYAGKTSDKKDQKPSENVKITKKSIAKGSKDGVGSEAKKGTKSPKNSPDRYQERLNSLNIQKLKAAAKNRVKADQK